MPGETQMVAKEGNMSALEHKSEIPQNEDSVASFEIAGVPKSPNNLSVPVNSLPKLVVCFDINTLSQRKLKAIASDLKVPGYSRMTKAELCEALLAL